MVYLFSSKNFFNLVVVSCYYSNRYENSEYYIQNELSNSIKNKICYLKNKTPEHIIEHFHNLI